MISPRRSVLTFLGNQIILLGMWLSGRKILGAVFLLQCPNLTVLLKDQGVGLAQGYEDGSHGGINLRRLCDQNNIFKKIFLMILSAGISIVECGNVTSIFQRMGSCEAITRLKDCILMKRLDHNSKIYSGTRHLYYYYDLQTSFWVSKTPLIV